MPRHPFADVLPDAFVRPLITTRPAADEFTARSPRPRAAGFVAAPVRVPHRLPVARRRTIPFSGTPAAATLAFDLSPLSSPVPVDRLVAIPIARAVLVVSRRSVSPSAIVVPSAASALALVPHATSLRVLVTGAIEESSLVAAPAAWRIAPGIPPSAPRLALRSTRTVEAPRRVFAAVVAGDAVVLGTGRDHLRRSSAPDRDRDIGQASMPSFGVVSRRTRAVRARINNVSGATDVPRSRGRTVSGDERAG